jgi:DNA-binding NarL/FixJ family response regulator
MIKILIVEPQTAENSLERIISGQPDIETAGVTDNLSTAKKLCSKLMPDILLIDMTEGNNTITQAAQILREYPNIKIVIWTSLAYNTFAAEARKANIHSYIDKNTGIEYLLTAIRFTIQDKGIYCQRLEKPPFTAT